jgi:hypothetical protein
MREAKSDSLAQKKDLAKLASVEDLNKVKTDLQSEIALKIKETELNIIKWIAGMLIAQIGLTLAILKFIEKI